jgi:hypothetical protein
LGLTNVLAEIVEIHVHAGKTADAKDCIRKGLPLAMQRENRYAIAKFREALKRLGIDLESFLGSPL